ncbi:MAG: NosD domain-containing protein [Candidatus Bathyarchaeia archaeon]
MFISKNVGEIFAKDFYSVQEAINEAENGAYIYIPSGVYYENVIVNKSVSLFGKSDFTAVIDGKGMGSVIEVTATNVTIAFLKLQNSGYGWNRHGVYVDTADNCTIRNNLFTNNCHNIKLNYSSNSQVVDNCVNGTMTSPTMYGIRIENSTNCTVAGNDISDCVGAIHLQNATNCIVRNNTLHENSQGIRFYSPCEHNKVTKNMVCNNTYDGMVSTMPGNATFFNNCIFHNNFVNNTNPFIIDATGFVWDAGYPAGGNYWSRYNGSDNYRGVFQNETGDDGIGDTQYLVGSNNVDHYPLMHEWSPLPVHNINKGTAYNQIQEALEAPETVSGNRIFVDNGVYEEHVVLDKSVSLLGEDPQTTIIDGGNTATVLTLKADNINVAGFTIRNSGLMFPPYGNDCGVLLEHCSKANISHLTVANSRIGIYLYDSENNTIEHNTVHSNKEEGILLWHSGNNTLKQNTVFNNARNFGVFGDDFADFENFVGQCNTVNGKPIHYLISVNDIAVENQTNIGVLYLVNCTNITIRNLEFKNNTHGVFLFNVSNSKIENVTSCQNSYGISLQASRNNLIRKNTCISNWVGLLLQDSNENSIENNILDGGEKGISLYNADNNTIKGNTVANATFGIRLYASSYNKAFYNNLLDNFEHVSVLQASYQNLWDNSVEGNYWGNSSRRDENNDGIVDDSYYIDLQNKDNKPLLGQSYTFETLYLGNLHEVSFSTNSTVLNFAFNESSRIITIRVSGSETSAGFCRVSVPRKIIEPELSVIIDNGLTTLLYANYTLLEDELNRWIYFAYPHSQHEIVIVAEYGSSLLYAIALLSTYITLIIAKKRSCFRRLPKKI